MPRLGKRPHSSSNRSRVNERTNREEDMDDEQVVNECGEGGESEDEKEEDELERSMMDQMKRRAEKWKREDTPVPGIIKSAHLINFMGYSTYEIDFGPRINVLIGRDRDEQNAIAVAIRLGLGGRATNDSPTAQLYDFIKPPGTISMIILKLHNYTDEDDKHLAYKPDTYGKTIIIETTAFATSSTYVVKDEHGKIIADIRREVDDMVEHFRIPIDNPICNLTQQVKENFLDPKYLYTFFMQAIDLEKDMICCEQRQENLRISLILLQEKERNLSLLKMECEVARRDTEEYRTSQDRYEQAKEDFKSLRRNIKELEKSLRLEERQYREFRSTLSMSALVFYQLVSDQMGFEAELKIYHRETRDLAGTIHEKKTLTLKGKAKVDPLATSMRDIRFASSEEQSFLIIVLFICLFEVNGTPFRILDERNLIDPNAREAIMELLSSYVARKRGRQFIFLSPQKISIKEEYQAITSVQEIPEPGQTS